VKRLVIAACALVALAGVNVVPSVTGGSVATAATRWPVKIFSVGTPATKVGAALNNPYVSGISVRFSWANLEPSPGSYRWDLIDNVIAQAKSADKLAMIRVLSGINAPDWVQRQVTTLTFADDYLYNPAAYPSTVTMPVPWDPDYLTLWERFVTALGRRYDGNSRIYSVQMAGGGFIGEMTLPTDVKKWLAAGYSDDRYARCWNQIIHDYRAAFPTTPINLDIVEPFGGVMKTDVVGPVVAFATDPDRKKAYIQSNALRPDMLGFIGPYRSVIRSVSGSTRVGYQMIGAMPTASALRDAFTVALQDNVSYVEVYGSDVLDPNNQSALRYLASG
jgi:hypothetical protein